MSWVSNLQPFCLDTKLSLVQNAICFLVLEFFFGQNYAYLSEISYSCRSKCCLFTWVENCFCSNYYLFTCHTQMISFKMLPICLSRKQIFDQSTVYLLGQENSVLFKMLHFSFGFRSKFRSKCCLLVLSKKLFSSKVLPY